MRKDVGFFIEFLRAIGKVLLWALLLPFKLLFGSSLKKKISNPKKWKESRKGNLYYRIRENFVVICYPFNDNDKEREDNIFDHFRLMVKKDGDTTFINNKFDIEEEAIENSYSALKQLKLA